MANPFGFLNRDNQNVRRVTPRPAAMPPRYYERTHDSRQAPPLAIAWRRVGILSAIFLATCGLLYGTGWLLTGDTLRVRTIAVEGVQVTDPQTIAQVVKLGGESMFLVDTAKAATAVAKLPAVKAATVTRVWPHGVRIDVTEHQAWGYWQTGPQRVVIDADGRILQASRPPAADAPTVAELGAPKDASGNVAPDPDTVRLIDRLRTDGAFGRLNVKPTGFVFQRDRGLTVMVANGPAAIFGDSSNYDFKVKTWEALLREPQALASAAPAKAGAKSVVSEIDLRFGRNVVLR